MNFGSKISARKPNYSLSFTFSFFKSEEIFSCQNGSKTKRSRGYANRTTDRKPNRECGSFSGKNIVKTPPEQQNLSDLNKLWIDVYSYIKRSQSHPITNLHT